MATLPTTLGANPVPTYTGTVQTAKINPYEAEIESAKGMAALGRAVGAGGEELNKEVIAANELAIEDAVNRAKQKALDMAYDPDKGYLNVKGANAIHRPDGRTLAQEVSDSYIEELNTIASTLTPYQRERFLAEHSPNLVMGMTEDVRRHTLGEFKVYNDSVQDGKIKLAEQEISSFYNDVVKIEEATKTMDNAVYMKARTAGLSPDETIAMQRETKSKALTNALSMMVVNNKATMANDLLGRWKKDILPSDLIKVNEAIKDSVFLEMGNAAVKQATKQVMDNINPSPTDRLFNVAGADRSILFKSVAQVESGGKDYDEKGNLIVSPKGAEGMMQVMPATSKNPGYGVLPAKDGSIEERNRVGRDYLSAMIKEFNGDVSMAVAAYNAGPNKVKGAIISSLDSQVAGDPKPWTYYLPEETQQYVAKVASEYEKGAGANAFPSQLEYVRLAEAKIPEGVDPDKRAKLVGLAKSEYVMLKADYESKQESVITEGQKELIDNGGNFAAISNKYKNNPAVYEELGKFAKTLVEDKKFDAERYNNILNNGSQMPNSKFYSEIASLPDNDQRTLVKAREKGVLGFSMDAYNSEVNRFLRASKLNPSTKDSDELYKIATLKQAILYSLQESKETIKPENLYTEIAKIANRQVVSEGWLWDSKKPVYEMAYEDIPDEIREAVETEAEKRGVVVDKAKVLASYIKRKG